MDITTRLERIVHLFFLLQSRSLVTNEELQERFGIGRRTVYRDLKVLEQAGVPVVNETGDGFSILEGFRLRPARFSHEEVLSLVIAEKLMEKHETGTIRRNFDTAITKIKGSFRYEQKEDSELLGGSLAVEQSPKGADYLPEAIDVLLRSMLTKTQVRLRYQNSGSRDQTERTIEPAGVTYESGAWYLWAYCHLRSDYRSFRIDRIRAIAATGEAFAAGHPPVAELRSRMTAHATTPIVLAVQFRYAHFLYWERETFGFTEERPQGAEVVMHFECAQPVTGFARWFLRFADKARILSPASLRDEVAAILKESLANLEEQAAASAAAAKPASPR